MKNKKFFNLLNTTDYTTLLTYLYHRTKKNIQNTSEAQVKSQPNIPQLNLSGQKSNCNSISRPWNAALESIYIYILLFICERVQYGMVRVEGRAIPATSKHCLTDEDKSTESLQRLAINVNPCAQSGGGGADDSSHLFLHTTTHFNLHIIKFIIIIV